MNYYLSAIDFIKTIKFNLNKIEEINPGYKWKQGEYNVN
jgi:hypothetical protein